MKILLTGASGFVGRALCPALQARGHLVTVAVRNTDTPEIEGVARTVVIGDMGPDTDWTKAVDAQDAIIHLAARAHVMTETTADPQALYHRVNVEATQALVDQAAKLGTPRLIFLSSIKVNGEQTFEQPFTEDMPPAPEDAYGRTKYQAEQLINNHPGLNSTIIRTPLVYGPGVKGNFLKLMGLCKRGYPLPLASIKNQRSFIFLDNLTSALIAALENDASIGQTYLVSDGHDLSTPELVKSTAKALGRSVWLLPFPVFALRMVGLLSGKSSAVRRLCGSLQVDNRKIQSQLAWTPPTSPQQGLEKTAVWYQKQSNPEGALNAS